MLDSEYFSVPGVVYIASAGDSADSVLSVARPAWRG